MKGLYEILTEKKWMVSPDFVHGMRKALEQNLNAHAAFSKPAKSCGFVSCVAADGTTFYPEEYLISEDGRAVNDAEALFSENGQEFPFVSVITIDGPITRNGGGCSYGSVDHRDMMMAAADHPLCRGHVFVINTPGGSAWAKNDYEQAIEYARKKGQPVIAFIDGMCASAGMYLAALCDERYYMHPKDEVGCIGVMAAFYTEADGSVNQYSNETYHEIYDPESFEKNKAMRDIANDGNTEDLIKELADLGVEFRNDVKKRCPAATEEHLHGKVFAASDVEGILVDGQSTFLGVVRRAFSLCYGKAEDIKRAAAELAAAGGEGETPDTLPEDPQPEQPEETLTNNTINMENYPLINAACGLDAGELAVKEEGAFMNAALLESLEGSLGASVENVAEAENKATAAENALTELQGKFDALTAQLAEVSEAKAVAEKALAEALDNHGKEMAEQTARLTETEANLKGAQDALTTAQQTIADRDEQIAALTAESGEEPEAGDAPQNNGEGAREKALREFNPAAYKTNAARKAAFEAFTRGE